MTKEIVNTTPEKDTDFWRAFSQACHRKKIDPENLKANLMPVAGSLGLIVRDNLQQDYYTLLGVDPSSSFEEVRKAYHHRAKSLHPDTRKNGENDQAFIELADGYRVLKDPALRAHYDKSRQSIGRWHERITGKNRNRDESGRKSRRNRYFFQLCGVIILMISVVFVFNLIYESQAINDGFYIPPEPEKLIPDLKEKAKEADRVNEQPEQNGSERESLSPDLKGWSTSNPSIRMGKTGSESTGISRSDKKQASQSGHVASVGKRARSVRLSRELGRKPDKGRVSSSFRKNESKEAIENTMVSVTSEQHDRLSELQTQAVKPTRPKEKAVGKKKPLLSEKNIADSPSEDRFRPSAGIEADQNPVHSASELLRKFVEKDDEMNRVTAFIRQYSKLYMEKDYSEFSRLFTKDATENGKAFSELAPDYRRIFTALESLKYQIIMHKTSFLVDQGVVRVGGVYKITWQPYDGMLQESEGPISFEIVKRNGKYRVRKLVYGQIKPK